jgi:hypothetical protein
MRMKNEGAKVREHDHHQKSELRVVGSVSRDARLLPVACVGCEWGARSQD